MNMIRGLLVLLLFSCINGFSQTSCDRIFSGTVTDENGATVEGATILLMPLSAITITDSAGRFVFNKVCPGTYTVSVRYLGYKQEEVQVQIDHATEMKVIHLVPDTRKLKEVIVQGQSARNDGVQNFSVMTEKDLEQTAGKTLGETLK